MKISYLIIFLLLMPSVMAYTLPATNFTGAVNMTFPLTIMATGAPTAPPTGSIKLYSSNGFPYYRNATGSYILSGGAISGGSGDVVGPAGATSHNFASYASASGKTLEDSGKSASSFADASATTNALALKATKVYADSKINKTGDTMAGNLAMGTNKLTGLGSGSSSADSVTYGQVLSQGWTKINKSGDTMSGPLAMGSQKVTGVLNGTASQDAVTYSQMVSRAPLSPDVIVWYDGSVWRGKFANGTAITSSTNTTTVFRQSLLSTPLNGTLQWGHGTATIYCNSLVFVDAALTPTGFYFGLLRNSSIKIIGDGMGSTILKMAPNQYYVNHPAVVFGMRNYTYCDVSGFTINSNKAQQTPTFYDGAGGLYTYNKRYYGNFHDIEVINSPCHGFYFGSSGTGCSEQEKFHNLYTRNSACTGTVFDENRYAIVDGIYSYNDCATLALYGETYIGINMVGWATINGQQQYSKFYLMNSGLKLSQVGNCTVSGVNVYGSMPYGVWTINCKNVVVQVNEIINNAAVGWGFRNEAGSNTVVNVGFIQATYPISNYGTTPSITVTGGKIQAIAGTTLYCDTGTMTVIGSRIQTDSGHCLGYAGAGTTFNLVATAAPNVQSGITGTGTIARAGTLNCGP